ncbi:MAG: cytochrome c, partial [Flavobacteriaceae bacterium]|nr:cytochrome c [Flavobacteriaceae bacterium]
MKTFKILTLIGIISFALLSFTAIVQDEWIVPDEYVNMENPIDADTDKAIGKSLYNKHCKSCHGK